MIVISTTITSPYHAAGNGLTGRSNKTMARMIRCLKDDHPNIWDRYLPQLARAYNTTTQESTGVTPHELFFGRPTRTPIDLLINPTGKEQARELADDIRYAADETKRIARENMIGAQSSMVDSRPNRRPVFQVGDYVMCHNPKAHKLDAVQWIEPFRITKRIPPNDPSAYYFEHTALTGPPAAGHPTIQRAHFSRQQLRWRHRQTGATTNIHNNK